MSQKTVLIILGNGFEEIEALAPADLLRRAEVSCKTASVEPDRWVTGRSGIRVEADAFLHEVEDQRFDALIIPGGPGTAELRKNPHVLEMVRVHRKEDKIIGAICAAPTVLLDAGVLPGPKHTGHMSILPELPEIDQEQAVVVDGKVITSRGAGTAIEFGLAVAFVLTGQEVAEGVAKSIHYV
uniref:4-methyl-5(B-hydroxyethyl)-thiazole monophosphate biosynthesis n=1 Tax=Candidatus Kentrum sp. LFY TaxID=2126342 RepID=A0A450WXC6_9GAMM|nr:MAG: 4-methyl-5(b-hydroxyethyl)-thiazole monophosphate biosynthesis [Candidatus Kentron sp. LFY]